MPGRFFMLAPGGSMPGRFVMLAHGAVPTPTSGDQNVMLGPGSRSLIRKVRLARFGFRLISIEHCFRNGGYMWTGSGRFWRRKLVLPRGRPPSAMSASVWEIQAHVWLLCEFAQLRAVSVDAESKRFPGPRSTCRALLAFPPSICVGAVPRCKTQIRLCEPPSPTIPI